jgi:quercetin dioxygenase-like cupin family protein
MRDDGHVSLAVMPPIAIPQLPVREIFPGIRARLVHTDRVTHSWVELDEGASFPDHHHPHEQIVSVLDGTLDIVVGSEAFALTAGQVLVIPPDVPHHGRARTFCRVLDAFAPVREEYK